jgi:HAMP domain-containing protein
VLRRFVKAGDLSQSTNVPAAKDAVGALKIIIKTILNNISIRFTIYSL